MVGRLVNGAVSRELSWAVYDDAQLADEQADHPCHRFLELQPGVAADRWRLPVPFMGRSADRGIVFLGANPSWDRDNGRNQAPRWNCGFDEFDRHFRECLDPPPAESARLDRLYQEIGEHAILGFRLGADALVLEAIHCRTSGSQGCWNREVWGHERRTTLAMMREVAPKVVVRCGAGATWCLRDLLTGLQGQLPASFRQGGRREDVSNWHRVGPAGGAPLATLDGVKAEPSRRRGAKDVGPDATGGSGGPLTAGEQIDAEGELMVSSTAEDSGRR